MRAAHAQRVRTHLVDGVVTLVSHHVLRHLQRRGLRELLRVPCFGTTGPLGRCQALGGAPAGVAVGRFGCATGLVAHSAALRPHIGHGSAQARGNTLTCKNSMNPKYQNIRARLPKRGSLRARQSQEAIANEATPMLSEIGVEKHMITDGFTEADSAQGSPRPPGRVTDVRPAFCGKITGEK